MSRRTITTAVPGLGIAIVAAPTSADERFFARSYYGESDAVASDFVDAAVSHTTRSPALSYGDVAALAQTSRAALRLALADACGLGAAASATDEALFLAMRERSGQLAERSREQTTNLLDLLVGLSDELRTRARAAARGPDVERVIGEWGRRVKEAGDQSRQLIEFYEQQPLGFVVSEMRLDASLELLLDAAEKGDHVVLQAVEEAVLADGMFLDEVRAAVSAAACLTPAQRDELEIGLEALLSRRDAPACRLLMGASEGALWTGADRQGVVNERNELIKSHRPGRPQLRRATSVNSLLDEDVGIRLTEDFRLFLRNQLWDGHGHSLRHGRVDTRVREYSVWALIALCGWIDQEERTYLMGSIGKRLDAALGLADAA